MGAAQRQAGDQRLDLGQRWHQGVEGRQRFHRGADDQVRQLPQRRGIDIGEQHDPGMARLGRAGYPQGLGLIAAVVEQQHQVLALDIEQAVRQLRIVFQQQAAGAHQAQVVEQVVGEETAEASAKAVHRVAVVLQPVHEHAHVFGLGQGLGVLQRALAVRQVAAPGVALSHLRPGAEQGAGGPQAVVHVAEQGFLEFAVAAETELFHQPHDGRITDPGVFRQARHRSQAVARVVVEQRAHHLAFRGRQVEGRVGDQVFERGHRVPWTVMSVLFHEKAKLIFM